MKQSGNVIMTTLNVAEQNPEKNEISTTSSSTCGRVVELVIGRLKVVTPHLTTASNTLLLNS